ncbi:MAG: hypothetical protein A2902_02140 [Elusimicrobia bacterium RIFCSPLOWO2_01_FULL_64_13]|nr:MAG: hypothetical protein A2636_07070 [Elusimicrobia bacterium RIFCSPHIGHO2_01_FULL_64_10]OGR95150.1 MAG: hypothetical protein A2902_02140 [Elusimicrobia bacterium RIFCSPLOWO2_01_FULL_64_13]
MAGGATWAWNYKEGLSGIEKERLWELPQFRMVSAADGKPFGSEDLRGKVWVAGFIFTRCQGPCPVITANMARLQSELPDGARLVSFTVDPEWDDADVLRGYMEEFGADPSLWVFLTGDPKTLYDLLYRGFKLPVMKNPGMPGGFAVTHSSRLVLVDPDGVARATYEGTSPDSLKKIVRDARALLKEPRT